MVASVAVAGLCQDLDARELRTVSGFEVRSACSSRVVDSSS
jgi:hypothetical protein